MTTTADALQHALQALAPTHISLENESHMHAGYFEGKESHFKLTIVSDAFTGLRLAARHQKVYAIANPFLMTNGGTVHALAIHAYTPDEWANMSAAPDSPLCASRRT
ncbi:BolA family transcriptional regulator [Moraxella sp. FZFQ2102]|uniref:BolA family protein n=1 Tax=Moraxella sp. FZFQ2102 TaxID=2953752 RepID=UPI00209C4AEB|nr:BolA family protein [Moraxella sp. FZFQ2102]USZ15577.1 BolA family transcriptional regulator [Moraxella sp. FZFQ2102]